MKTIRRFLAGLLLVLVSITAQAQLTSGQLTTFKAALLADPNVAAWLSSNQYPTIANYYNTVADATFFVWQTTTSVANIEDAITWANLTPTDAPDATVTYTNRALVCQIKQMNLQIMMQGKDSISSGKANIRQGLQDALTNVPSGVAGALVNAGWSNVKPVLTRNVSRIEKLLATGTGTPAAPATLTLDGAIVGQDVIDAIQLP